MIDKLLIDILKESRKDDDIEPTERSFIESILNNIYHYIYKSGQPVHTIAIGILRGNTFDMYYKGRIQEKFAEVFGAMSYETTIAGRACEKFKTDLQPYLNLFSKSEIIKEYTLASKDLLSVGLDEEAEALQKRAMMTIDQGVGSLLLIPLVFGKNILGIFTISSMNEFNPEEMLGNSIEKVYLPLSYMLSLLLYMEKLSYDKADEMSRLLISSIDGKDEFQTTHSSDVRIMIDIFIDELSRDKALRNRLEGMGFKLTVDKIKQLRLAALLHDMGKIFVPSEILRKGKLDKNELLIRKMHSYYTYNILRNSRTLGEIADISSKHHARYFIPLDLYEKHFIGHPFDKVGQDTFNPESQIIALADTFNSIVRDRPDREGLDFHDAITILERDKHKFHSGLKDIFLTIIKRVEKNLADNSYSPEIAEKYRQSLWLKKEKKKTDTKKGQWFDFNIFLSKIKYNTLGIVSIFKGNDMKSKLLQDINLNDKPVYLTNIDDTHLILSIIEVPKEEGFIMIFSILEYLKKQGIRGKVAFTFVSKNGQIVKIPDMLNLLLNGLNEIKNEPVHYYLHPEMLKIN